VGGDGAAIPTRKLSCSAGEVTINGMLGEGIKIHYRTASRRVFETFNGIFFILLSFLCLFPVIHILAVSFSHSTPAAAGRVSVFPVDFTIAAYEYVLSDVRVLRAAWISLQRTAMGTALNMTLICLAAYPLSKERSHFRFRTVYAWFFVITILFSGGLIPWFMTIRALGLIDSIWALILPGAVPVWSTIIMMNFIRGMPKELFESAYIDGAGHFRTLLQIVLPLAKPALATLFLFAAVGHWNAWFDGMVLMNRTQNWPLQTYLQNLLFVNQATALTREEAEMMMRISNQTVRAANIFVATVPILMVYPFLQKHFVKGLVLGSVKG